MKSLSDGRGNCRWTRMFAAVCLGFVLAGVPVAVAQQVGSLSTFHVFDGYDGGYPAPNLIQASDGNLYGTTAADGTNQYSGTVYKITLGGTLTTLHNFSALSDGTGGTNREGAGPGSGVIQGKDGNFYGVTGNGGANGRGTVFKMTPAGVTTAIYSFGTNTSDPYPVIQGTDGNFYGTIPSDGATGVGVVYQLTPAGVYTVLHSFSQPDDNYVNADGAHPSGALMQAMDGNFYGTTSIGGAAGSGVVYKITSGGVFTTLHSLSPTHQYDSGNSDGIGPTGSLIQAKDGNLYGLTDRGGAGANGTAFRITPAGVFSVLFNFDAYSGYPLGSLLQCSDGNFYGTTNTGGFSGYGSYFRLTPDGTRTLLQSIGPVQGVNPAGLFQANNGKIYGAFDINGGFGYLFDLTVTSPNGTLQFSSDTYNVPENGKAATIHVSRVNGSAGAVSVAYGEQNGSAQAGTDYTAAFGTLTWADGDAADKTFVVPIIDRHLTTGSVTTFYVTLSEATGGALLGLSTTANVGTTQNEVTVQPTITLASPPDGITAVAGASLPLAASVNDPSGILTQVQFQIDGQTVSTLTASPYVYAATVPAAPGTHQILAVATDAQQRTSSSAATLTVVADDPANPAPNVAILTSLDGRSLAAGSTVTLNVSATASDGTSLQRVDFYANGALFASLDGSGNAMPSAGPGPGRPTRRDASALGSNGVFQVGYQLPGTDALITLVAKALDQLGRSQVSPPVTVHSVASTNDHAPTVTLTDTTGGATVKAGTALSLPVAVSGVDADAGAAVSKMEYFVNDSQVAVYTSAPYPNLSFVPTGGGKYVLRAVATDASGLSGYSAPVVLNVDGPPTVTIVIAGDGIAVEHGGQIGKAFVFRTGDASLPLTVSYKVKGAAVAGLDYKPLPGVVTIQAGASKAKIKVKPLDNPEAGTRKAKIKLLPASDGSYMVGDPSLAKIKVIDNG